MVDNKIYDTPAANTVLNQVHEGMVVEDRNHHRIGKVDGMFLGGVSDDVLERGKGPATAQAPDTPGGELIELARRAFGGDDLPDVLRNRLLRNGFIHVDADGLLASDRYVMPEQISDVSGDTVTLNVTRDELIKQ